MQSLKSLKIPVGFILCTGACTAASSSSGRHYDPSNGKFMDIYFRTKCDHHNPRGFRISWLTFLISHRGGVMLDIRDQNDFDKLEAQNRTTASPGLRMSVEWKSSRVAQWHYRGWGVAREWGADWLD